MNPGERFRELAERIGGISDGALDHFVYWQGPGSLENWTLNVVEVLLIGMAVAGLVNALRHRARTGESSRLAIWSAAVGYCIAIEVPIYFIPQYLGLGDDAVLFIHNEFSGGIFFGRTPYYILALYPALLYPSYLLVRRLGVFERAGIIAAGATMGVVHHAFYEIFDHLGPQLRWWLWDAETLSADVAVASVPHYSQVTFSLVCAGAFGVLAHRLIERRPDRLGRGVARTSIQTLGRSMLFAPNVIYALLVDDADGRLVAASAATVWAAAVVLSIRTVRAAPLAALDGIGGAADTQYLRWSAAVFLATFALLWGVAIPDLANAAGARTNEGDPIGSPIYALACAAAVVVFVHRAVGWTGRTRRSPVEAPSHPVDSTATPAH